MQAGHVLLVLWWVSVGLMLQEVCSQCLLLEVVGKETVRQPAPFGLCNGDNRKDCRGLVHHRKLHLRRPLVYLRLVLLPWHAIGGTLWQVWQARVAMASIEY
jgi:hypothetical protein